MKLSFPTRALQTALRDVRNSTGVVDFQHNPVEGSLLVTVDENRHATLAGVSVGRVSEVRYDGQLSSADPGSFAVVRQDFERIVSILSGDNIDVDVDVNLAGESTRAIITSGTASFTLPTTKGVSFAWTDEESSLVAVLEGPVLEHAVTQVHQSTSNPDKAASVRLQREPSGDVTLASSDGYRLAVATVPTVEVGEFEPITLPSYLFMGGVTGLAQREGKVSIFTNDHHVTFQAGKTTLRIRHYDGTSIDFVSYLRKVVPTNTIKVNRDELLGVIDRVTVLAFETPEIYITLRDAQMHVVLGRQETRPANKGEDRCDATYDVPEGTAVRLNSYYLKKVLAAMDGADVTIGFTHPEAALIITSEVGFEAMLQPIRL